MAMKKAEMETHRYHYHARMAKARAAQKKGLFRDAVSVAFSSWEFIDGMMQYERRYEDKEFDGIEAIDLVLRFAPLLLDFGALDKLEDLLKQNRRINRNTEENLATRLAEERALLKDIHRLWNLLERHPGILQNELRQHLGGKQDRWRDVAEDWEKMGLIRRTHADGSYRLALATRLGEIVPAKCSSCGTVSEAPKAMMLEDTACPHCRSVVPFVLVTSPITSDSKE